MKIGKKIAASLVAAGMMISGGVTYAAEIPQPTYPKFTDDVTITWWSWTTNADKVIAEFNKVYPNIHVDHPLIGNGKAEYPKLQTVLKAGTGAPDVVQIEYQYLPQFIETGGLADIAKYVNPYKSYFQDWTWNQVSRGDKVYAVPEDIGPLGFLYREDVFKKYNLAIPKTYQQLADEAAKLHQANPNMYYAYFPITDGGQITSFLWQGGAQPFQYTPDGWKINLNSPNAKKVLNFWGDLIKKGYVKAEIDGTPQWQSDIGSGQFATLIGAAWTPSYFLQPYVKPGTDNWKVADTPQWDANGKFVNGNWGGSTNAVTTQSKHQEAAALFAAWINTSQAGNQLALQNNKQGGRGLFPADKYGTQLPEFSAPNKALSGQVTAPIWVNAAKGVDVSFQWSPWTDYVYKQITVEIPKAAQGQETWDQALDNLQNNTVAFAKSMGYKVIDNNQSSVSGKSNSGTSTGSIVLIVLVVLGIGVVAIRRFKVSA